MPYDCLLDKYATINSEGVYESFISDPNKRFAASLSGLIRGRLTVIKSTFLGEISGLTMSIRYAAAR